MFAVELMAQFETSPLLVGLTEDQLETFFAVGEEIKFGDGDQIIQKGSPGDALYLIVGGRVRIALADGVEVETTLSSEDTLQEQYAGDFFGEMSIVDFEMRSADVYAVGETRVYRMPREKLFEMFAKDIDVQVVLLSNIARILARRLRTTNQHLKK
ncbi:MAG: cyclic nucleotide-binding domain-containing protein [Candidatus Lindowbacteria bacterium]|nr:cyclic nucleotide-binding domain-containing protein [Candidatus Lindowbacteria bacterium]